MRTGTDTLPLGSAERTDALLEALKEIRAERDAANRWWQFGVRWGLDREIIAFTGELQRNERLRVRTPSERAG